MNNEEKDDSLDRIAYLAALGWPDNEIFISEGIDEKSVPEEVREAIEHGRLKKRADIEIAVARAAASGTPEAVKQFNEVVRDKSFSISKLDLFGGPEDQGAFERIQDYIAEGSKGNLSQKEQVYIDLLTMIYSLDGQWGKRRTIKFLTSKPFSFSYEQASNMYAESIEMFFANRKVSKEAMRAKMADQYDTLYTLAMQNARTTKDFEIAAGILSSKAKVLRLDQDDPQQLPAENYSKQFRVLSLSPEVIGLPRANRDELARQIDGIVAPEAVKKRLRVDAGIDDLDIVKLMDNVAQEES
nr:MAG TPA: hypothetical protein [Caudoviricetes sp.]